MLTLLSNLCLIALFIVGAFLAVTLLVGIVMILWETCDAVWFDVRQKLRRLFRR